jgi:hypothetical protein
LKSHISQWRQHNPKWSGVLTCSFCVTVDVSFDDPTRCRTSRGRSDVSVSDCCSDSGLLIPIRAILHSRYPNYVDFGFDDSSCCCDSKKKTKQKMNDIIDYYKTSKISFNMTMSIYCDWLILVIKTKPDDGELAVGVSANNPHIRNASDFNIQVERR